MFKVYGFGRRGHFGLKVPQSAAIVVAAALAGCSADITRFDSTSFALNDPPERVHKQVAESAPSNSDIQAPVARSVPRGPYGAGAKTVEVAALPDPAPSYAAPAPSTRRYSPQDWRKSPDAALPAGAVPLEAAQPTSVPAAPAVATTAQKGELIEVAPGETLYGLSKRHRVSLTELMQVNGMTNASLKPGQKLYLPARAQPVAANAAAPKLVLPATTLPPPTPAMLAKYQSTYTVKAGDSLYGISRAYRVPYTELQQANAITDVRKVKPGAIIKVPGTAPAAAETLAQQSTPPVAAPPVAAPPRLTQAAPAALASPPAQPSIINAPKKVAALTGSVTDASPAPAAPLASAAPAAKADKVAVAVPQATRQAGDSVKLRWPAQGKVISGFGGRPDGTHNDGINMSVPLGTDVHAAESGVVAYAGSELKGYGNLVLVRHDNGWVTAYAHNDELMVKRGDKISRGQVIAKAGKTGTVDQPQVHFELRQGSKPVDPTPFMEKI